MTKLKINEKIFSHSSRHVHSVIQREWGNNAPFKNIVTLDPHLAQDAWDILCTNTRAVEYHELPSKLHRNFVRALNHKRTLEKLFG
ncbi:hypothetical protein VWY66_09510 [Phaeobacter sp. JH18-10]